MEKILEAKNISKQYPGEPIEKWISIVNKQNFDENKDIVNFLKEEHSVGHFYAHLIAKKSK